MYLFVGNGWVFPDKLFVATIYVFEGNKVIRIFPQLHRIGNVGKKCLHRDSKNIPYKNTTNED